MARAPQVILKARQWVPIYQGNLYVLGTLELYFSYQLLTGQQVFNSQPIEILIQEVH